MIRIFRNFISAILGNLLGMGWAMCLFDVDFNWPLFSFLVPVCTALNFAIDRRISRWIEDF